MLALDSVYVDGSAIEPALIETLNRTHRILFILKLNVGETLRFASGTSDESNFVDWAKFGKDRSQSFFVGGERQVGYKCCPRISCSTRRLADVDLQVLSLEGYRVKFERLLSHLSRFNVDESDASFVASLITYQSD